MFGLNFGGDLTLLCALIIIIWPLLCGLIWPALLHCRPAAGTLRRRWHRLPLLITGLDVRVIPFRRVAMVTSTDLLILGRRAVILWRGRYPGSTSSGMPCGPQTVRQPQ
jgi:hypothetical protein